MGNVVKDKKDLLLLKDIIDYASTHDLSVDYLEAILKELLPKDENGLLTGYYIREKGSVSGMFVPDSNKILFSLDQIEMWMNRQVNDFSEDRDLGNKKTFKSYMTLFMLLHEIEHAYQYLMGKGTVDAPNDVLKKAYYYLYDLMTKHHYIVPRPVTVTKRAISTILYKANENSYLLERNANILGMEAVRDSALYNGNETMYNFFDEMMRTYLVCGYTEDNMGCIEETYRKILMHDKYKKFYHDTNLSDKEKVRYGFKIDDDIRKKILTLKMDI